MIHKHTELAEAVLAEPVAPDMNEVKMLLKASLAAAAPALAAFVMIFSTSVLLSLETAGLGRLGVAAAGVLSLSLAHLLWRGRWWAGVPSMAIYALCALFFGFKFIRPLFAYISVNPIEGLSSLFQPLLMLSPSLVLMLISIVLGLSVYRGVKLTRILQPRTVSFAAWGLLALWLVVLGGDYIYQQAAWRWVKSPDDLAVRLCSKDPSTKQDAEAYLLAMGEQAAPSLLKAMAVEDVDLDCLRQGAWSVLYRIGPAATPAILEAARNGMPTAVLALQGLGDKRAAAPLLEIYRDPKRKFSPEFDKLLKEAITKLDPSLSLD